MINILEIYNFIKACGPFVVCSTTTDGKPNARPFGAISTDGSYLYIATNRNKNVFKEIINNNNILIYTLKPGTREWLRVGVNATITDDYNDIIRLFEDNKILYERYNGTSDPDLCVFRLEVINAEKY